MPEPAKQLQALLTKCFLRNPQSIHGLIAFIRDSPVVARVLAEVDQKYSEKDRLRMVENIHQHKGDSVGLKLH